MMVENNNFLRFWYGFFRLPPTKVFCAIFWKFLEYRREDVNHHSSGETAQTKNFRIFFVPQ